VKSEAKTVAEYIASLPPERREAVAAVRETILDRLPDGYVEAMDWGMISYQVPLDRYPDTYNRKPLMYAALASQKGYMVVYMSAIYANASARKAFETAYEATGKRYDVGQSCVRFRTLEDLPLDVIGAAVAGTSVDDFIEVYERSRRGTERRKKADEKAKKGRTKGAAR
jgi:hypothetical protein